MPSQANSEPSTVDVESKTSGFSNGLKVATAGLAALAAGAAYTFGQFEQSQKVMGQTEAVLKSTNHAANVTAAGVTNLAGALSKKAGIDDEAIQTGENMILTFKNIQNQAGKGNDIFNQTTKAVLDMSVAMGQDMKSSAIQVGKALNDPIAGMSALSRVGVTFTESQKATIKSMVEHNNLLGAQKVILKELNSEFQGSAAAQATASGKMSVALGNLAETIGGLLAPAITAVLAKVTEWAQMLTNNLGPAMKAIGDFMSEHQGLVKTLAAVVGALVAAMLVWSGVIKVVTIAQGILNVVMALNPFALIALAVIAAAAIIITNWDKVKTFLLAAWERIKQVASFLWDDVAIFVLGPMKLVIDWLIEHWRGVKETILAIWNFIADHIGPIVQGIVDTIMKIVHAAETAFGWLEKLAHALPDFGGGGDNNLGLPGLGPQGQLPGLAAGGIVRRPTLAMIGEHGPEAVVPLGAGVGGVTINNHGTMIGTSPQALAVLLRDELLKLKSRNSTTGL